MVENVVFFHGITSTVYYILVLASADHQNIGRDEWLVPSHFYVAKVYKLEPLLPLVLSLLNLLIPHVGK